MGSADHSGPETAIEAPPERGWRPRIAGATLGLIVAALLAAAMVVLVIVRVGGSNDDRDRTLTRERHSYEVMLAARSVQASMASAEAALGRFAISADKGMGSTYYSDWLLAGAQITRLRQLVARDADEARLAARLSDLYDQRGAELAAPATRAAHRQGWPALNLFNAAGHSPRIAAIDATLDALRDHEAAVLAERFDQSDAAAVDAGQLSSLLSLIGLGLIAAAGGLGWAVAVAVRRRVRAESAADEAADRASWLREAVAERTRELHDANLRLTAEMADRALAEARLHQMQKMEAVGQLTGGIAHDFNNMLAVVVGGLELAKRRLDHEMAPKMADVSQHLDRAMDGANRAAALTRRLLGFARAEPLLPERIAAETVIAGMGELIDRTLGERVAVELRTASDCWPVFVDPLQLENAILNLAVNGRDAMDGAGTLVIAAENARLAAGAVGTLAAGDYLRIAVSDSGAGMTPAVLERVFEPFFTTKPVGKGTGLGMSQIFGFVRQSGGDIAIDSAVGEGTTVALYLPRSVAPPAALPAPPSAAIVRLPGPAVTRPIAGAPVLVVEDDPRVRVATVEALAELGYRPIACAGGEEALAALAEARDISVMITDVVMPGLTGPELAARVRALHPGVSILFVTGHAGDSATELRGEALLRKPFTVAALERAVGEAFARVDPTTFGAPAFPPSNLSAPPRRPGVAARG